MTPKELNTAAGNEFEIYLSAWRLYRRRKYQECIDLCKRSMAIQPAFLQAHFLAGEAYVAMKQYKKAVYWFSKAYRLHPDWYPTINRIQYCYELMKDDDMVKKWQQKGMMIPESERSMAVPFPAPSPWASKIFNTSDHSLSCII